MKTASNRLTLFNNKRLALWQRSKICLNLWQTKQKIDENENKNWSDNARETTADWSLTLSNDWSQRLSKGYQWILYDSMQMSLEYQK